jgi:hypothetical protein
MLAGAGVGFIIARVLFQGGLIGIDQILLVAAGVSLCAGAYTSYHGNRVWMMPSAFGPAEVPPTPKAQRGSLIMGGIGVGLLVFPIILHVADIGGPSRTRPSAGFSIFLLLVGAIPGFLLWNALRNGFGYGRFGRIDRDETPLTFWIYVTLNALAVLFVLLVVV